MGKRKKVKAGLPAGPAKNPVLITKKPASLMDLPAEIRNRIYKLVLCPPPGAKQPTVLIIPCAQSPSKEYSKRRLCFEGTTWSSRWMCPSCSTYYSDLLHQAYNAQTTSPRPSDLSLLLVSKTIYTEAFHIFYRNRLAFLNTDILGHFLLTSGHARRQQITDIVFVWQGHQPKWTFRLLKKCRNLKRVTIIFRGGYQPPGYAALREVRGLEEAKLYSCNDSLICFVGFTYWDRPNEELVDFDEEDLTRAMKRPRLKRDAGDPEETLDLFRTKRHIAYTGGWIKLVD